MRLGSRVANKSTKLVEAFLCIGENLLLEKKTSLMQSHNSFSLSVQFENHINTRNDVHTEF